MHSSFCKYIVDLHRKYIVERGFTLNGTNNAGLLNSLKIASLVFFSIIKRHFISFICNLQINSNFNLSF